MIYFSHIFPISWEHVKIPFDELPMAGIGRLRGDHFEGLRVSDIQRWLAATDMFAMFGCLLGLPWLATNYPLVICYSLLLKMVIYSGFSH
jgi:hypothetical protein